MKYVNCFITSTSDSLMPEFCFDLISLLSIIWLLFWNPTLGQGIWIFLLVVCIWPWPVYILHWCANQWHRISLWGVKLKLIIYDKNIGPKSVRHVPSSVKEREWAYGNLQLKYVWRKIRIKLAYIVYFLNVFVVVRFSTWFVKGVLFVQASNI